MRGSDVGVLGHDDAQLIRNTGVSVSPLGEDTEEDGMTLGELFDILGKHIILLVVTAVVVIAGVAVYTFTRPESFTAESTLFATYNGNTSDASDAGIQNSAGTYISNQMASYPELAGTEAVLEPVVKSYGSKYAVDGQALTVSSLGSMLTVTNPDGTYVLNLSVVAPEPQMASDLANAAAESLAKVVSSELYDSGEHSIVKLSVVQQADVPKSPSSPNIPLYLAAGVCAGLILGVGAAIIREMLARRIHDVSDLQSVVGGSAVLGVIPEDRRLAENRPIVAVSPDNPIAEEFRRIRTNLSFTASKDGAHGRLIVVSSTIPGEGKTTFCCNIAAALAENDASVLLIDADLRHPSVADRLGIEESEGLAHVLSGQAGVKDVVRPYWKPQLHIMPAGAAVRNSSVLINSNIMRTLLRNAMDRYDYVIVDTVPMGVANEVAVLGQMGNGVVIVSGKDRTYKNDLRAAMTELSELHIPVLGLVLNRADVKRSSSYGAYHYYADVRYGGDRGSSNTSRQQNARLKTRRAHAELPIA